MLHCLRALCFSAEISVFASLALFVAVGLHGCADHQTTTTSTAPRTTVPRPPGPTPPPTPPGPTPPGPRPPGPPASTTSTTTLHKEFKLNPISAKGNHLFDSVTGERFQIIGVGFPDGLLSAPIQTWIDVLVNIKKNGPNVNVIRLYEFPQDFFDHPLWFKDFMLKADELGVYVLVPGTTRIRYIDVTAKDAQASYTAVPVLDFGRQVVQGTYYPNTLAIVLGNEYFDPAKPSTFQFINGIKAYARDLKAYMAETCNLDHPIPLMYASRDLGDGMISELMEALSCGTAEESIDIFGNNNERWCDNTHTTAYDTVETFLEALQVPLPFFFSEMGCSKFMMGPRGKDGCSTKVCSREWNEISDFFEKYKRMDGFVAYAYWRDGPVDFNMFDERYANATLNDDGKNFFNKIAEVKHVPRTQGSTVRPECKQTFSSTKMFPVTDYKAYNKEKWDASTCPAKQYRSPRGHELLNAFV